MVIIDQFTKWVEAFPIPHQGASLVAEKFVNEVVARFGTPLELHTDQGTNFQSHLFSDVCRLLQIANTRTTPYHPALNEQVERFNRTILQMIRCYLSKGQHKWDEQIPLLLAAYRRTPHPGTAFTPNRLMLGREVPMPQDVMFEAALSNKRTDTKTWSEALEVNMITCQNIARNVLQANKVKQNKIHDLTAIRKTYDVGDLVLVSNEAKKIGKSPKLQNVWQGPYIVTKKIGSVLFQVMDQKGKKILHHNRLKLFVGEFVPTWIQKQRQIQACSSIIDDRRGN